jgi:hypothetical protein
VRKDVHASLGDFTFPPAATPTRPAKTALTPLPLFRGTVVPHSSYRPLDAPLHYQSELIKLGTVAPHGRGTDVYCEHGLVPTQRTTGQGIAGPTGLVMRSGVVTVLTAAESQAAQQLPEHLVLDQVLVGNAIPLGLLLHLVISLRDFLSPLLGTAFPPSPQLPRPPTTTPSFCVLGNGTPSCFLEKLFKAKATPKRPPNRPTDTPPCPQGPTRSQLRPTQSISPQFSPGPLLPLPPTLQLSTPPLPRGYASLPQEGCDTVCNNRSGWMASLVLRCGDCCSNAGLTSNASAYTKPSQAYVPAAPALLSKHECG